MKTPQDVVQSWGQGKTSDGKKQQAAGQGIEAFKQLASFRWHQIKRPHARQDHRGIGEGFDQIHIAEISIASDAHRKGYNNDAKRPQRIAP